MTLTCNVGTLTDFVFNMDLGFRGFFSVHRRSCSNLEQQGLVIIRRVLRRFAWVLTGAYVCNKHKMTLIWNRVVYCWTQTKTHVYISWVFYLQRSFETTSRLGHLAWLFALFQRLNWTTVKVRAWMNNYVQHECVRCNYLFISWHGFSVMIFYFSRSHHWYWFFWKTISIV